MSKSPLGARLTPEPIKRLMLRMARPYLERIINRYVTREFLAQRIMSLPHIDAKHNPVRPMAFNYIIPRQEPDASDSPDGLPVPPKRLWIGYGETRQRYLQIGRDNVKRMMQVLEDAGRTVTPGQRILDFGCGAGPMLRRFVEHAEKGEVWGVDINSDHMHWCMQNLSPPFRFAITSTSAHLPFEDNYFDFIYCGSVFSHIGEMASSWLLELARVIRPGGLLYLSMNSKESLRYFLAEWPDGGVTKELKLNFTQEQLESDFATLVVGRVPWQHAVYDADFFRRICEYRFNVVAITPRAYYLQTGFVLEKRAADPPRSTEEVGARSSVSAGGAAPRL
jgi:ubiquinone/menaquinone biosynthesis C-methylase UbiE